MAYGQGMNEPNAPRAADLPVHTDGLRLVALNLASLALATMPLAMWVASRSAPLFLAIAALACLVVSWREGWPLSDRLRALQLMRAPAALAMALFLLLALASMAWSHRPWLTLWSLGEFALPLASAAVVALFWPQRAPAWAPGALLFCLLLALTMTIVELKTGMAARQALGIRFNSYIFNRTIIFALLTGIPLLAWLITRQGWLAGIALLVVLAAALLVAESGASKLGIVAALLAAIATWLAPRTSILIAACCLVALTVLAPVKGEIADRLMPHAAHEQLKDAHSRDRVDIWQSFGEAIRARPLLGSGFGTTASLQDHPVALDVSPARRVLLGVGHPHSVEVQVWAELGLAGAGLMLWASLALLVSLSRRRRAMLIAPMAALAAAVAIAAVGHGAWQGWWIASLGASIIWFRLFDRNLKPARNGKQAP
jgi:O-antigen ligase